MDPTTVFLLDAHASTRTATANALRDAGLEIAGHAKPDTAGLHRSAASRAQVVVLTIQGRVGPAAVGTLRRVAPRARVLALTHDDEASLARAREAGAHGALPVTASPDEVARTIERLASGRPIRVRAVEAARRVPVRRETGTRSSGRPAAPLGDATPEAVTAAEALSRLTSREHEMLEMLAAGMTAPAIAKRLVISRRTVEFHLARAYRKLGVNGRIDAIMAFERLRRDIHA